MVAVTGFGVGWRIFASGKAGGFALAKRAVMYGSKQSPIALAMIKLSCPFVQEIVTVLKRRVNAPGTARR